VRLSGGGVWLGVGWGMGMCVCVDCGVGGGVGVWGALLLDGCEVCEFGSVLRGVVGGIMWRVVLE